MAKRKGKPVPPLENDSVTGMTDSKQQEAIRESAEQPRGDAAAEFIDEHREQAQDTAASGPAQPQADGDSDEPHAGIQRGTSGRTQLEQHWDPDRQRRQ
jgi:hypothetical protein